MLKRLANVEVSVADCERRKWPGASWVGVGIDQLRISDEGDVVGTRCSGLKNSVSINCSIWLLGKQYGIPSFPIHPRRKLPRCV